MAIHRHQVDETKFNDNAILPFELRLKDLQEFYGGAKKGDWDVGLTVDAIRTS